MKLRWQIFWHVFFWIAMMALFLSLSSTHNDPKYTTAELLIIFLLYPLINIMPYSLP